MNRVRRIALACAPAVVLPVAFAAATFSPACASAPSGQPVLATLSPLAACALQVSISDLVDGINDPVALLGAVATACAQYGEVTAAALATWIEEWISGTPAVDAGPLVATQLSRLLKVKAAAATQVHANPLGIEAGAQ